MRSMLLAVPLRFVIEVAIISVYAAHHLLFLWNPLHVFGYVVSTLIACHGFCCGVAALWGCCPGSDRPRQGPFLLRSSLVKLPHDPLFGWLALLFHRFVELHAI